MPSQDLTAYAAILISLTLAPGPLMAILIARTLAKDVRGAVGFGFGIALGDMLVIVLICTGMGLWLQSMPLFFKLTRLATLVYLLWLAARMWTNATNSSATSKNNNKGMLSSVGIGILTCVLSPQTILLYLVILPRVIDINRVTGMEIGLLGVFTFLILAFVFFCVIYMALRLQRFLTSETNNSYLNKLLAVVIVISGGWLVAV